MSRLASLPWSVVAVALVGAAVVLGLMWVDVLPGGWTLRGWVEPHAERAAREQGERSAARMALFRRENPSVEPGAIVFVGSSTVERFPLEARFPDARCVNRGIGNESSAELLARLDESLPDARPAGFVVYAASIDFRAEGAPPHEVAARVGRVLDALGRRHANVPILVLGLLSERDAEPAFVERLQATNRALATLAAERGAEFLDTGRPPVITAEGRLSEAHSADDLHLNERGYEVLAAWILEVEGPIPDILRGRSSR